MNWYSYKSKDGKIQGYCMALNKRGVARFTGYPLKELNIELVLWNGREFVKWQKPRKIKT